MPTIYLQLSTKSDGLGHSQVLLRLTGGHGITPRAKSGIFVPSKYWNEKKQRLMPPRLSSDDQRTAIREQRRLDELCNVILEEFASLKDKTAATSEWMASVVRRYHNPEEVAATSDKVGLFDAFDRFLRAKDYASSRRKSFLGLARILRRFELFRGEELTLDGFTERIVEDFDLFVKREHEYADDEQFASIYEAIPEIRRPDVRAQNTVSGIHARLRTFIRWANDQGFTTTNGYARFQVEEEVYGTPIYITNEERNALYAAKIADPKLAIQRDIFVFQCLIGCRVGDLLRMTRANIIRGAVEYVPRKTRDGRPVTVRVPLNQTAVDIVERYRRADDERLLPFISEQKYNEAIKAAFRAAGLDRVVTVLDPKTREGIRRPLYEIASSHLARRTFVGNLYKKIKDPNLIGSMSGHKDGSRAFARYREIDDEIKAEVVKLFD